MKKFLHHGARRRVAAGAIVVGMATCMPAALAALPGGSLDPLLVPKYVTPLVIPPVMPAATGAPGGAATYNIEVVQFQQQILPAADLNGTPIPPTTVWSYGAVGQPATRNYPAFTVEVNRNAPISVNWVNNLVDGNGNYLPHLVPIDQTLHWANPDRSNACVDANGNPDTTRVKDCRTLNGTRYTGPVPITSHVHGAHVGPESDGYPEAWYLPNAANIDCVNKHNCLGTMANTYGTANTQLGRALFNYPNDQPSTTLWYHDHTLGMTRANVYAGPAGFWLVRDSASKTGETGLASGVLPGPAPKLGDAAGTKYREIPIVIQDRSFNADGSLFYPDNRAFFEGLNPPDLQIPLIGDGSGVKSDISPIWNPEAFFNTMVVNGKSWPYINVDPRRYRLRLLNGSNSRFLNLAMFVTKKGVLTTTELPMNQIGGDQSLLPYVVQIKTGFATPLPGNGKIPAAVATESPQRALLMAPAERADIIVDFKGLSPGTRVRMINTAPDSPFGGFNGDPAADPATTGQVMEFVVGSDKGLPDDPSTKPESLKLTAFDKTFPALGAISNTANPRRISLNEASSAAVCVTVVGGTIQAIPGVPVSNPYDEAQFAADCLVAGGAPMGPKEALLGTVDATGMGMPMMWADKVTENPAVGATEQWDIHNNTEDAHPVHVHLVQFKVLGRKLAVVDPTLTAHPVAADEAGWKDTVIAYPGEITSVAAKFDIEGLYVWHCHILEHEDNEMMRPYCVGNPANCPK